MKKAIILASFLALIMSIPAKSQGSLELIAKLGLSTPNNQINNIYNSNTLKVEDLLGYLSREGAKLGYHFSLGIRYPLADEFKLVAGIAWHRFPETDIEVKNPNDQTLLLKLSTVQNVFPINVGVNFYPIPSDFINVYGVGELSYNYISYTVDYNDIPLNLDTSPVYNRVGFGLGAGIDLNVKLLILNLEAKYNIMNLIGKESGEPDKSYVTLSLGVVF